MNQLVQPTPLIPPSFTQDDDERLWSQLKAKKPPPSPQGQKFDQGKLDWALLPIEPTEDIIRVLMHGAGLYGRENWKEVENGKQRYWNAAMRHLMEHRKGVRLDPSTGLSHLAHAGCNILFLLELRDDQEATQEERAEPIQPSVGA